MPTARGSGTTPGAGDRARALALLRRYGWDSTSFQILDGACRLWFAEDAVVAYADTGRTLVGAGAPVCSPERASSVARNFASAAAGSGRAAAFFAVSERFAAESGLASIAIGEVGAWSPQDWPEVLSRTPSLREQLRRGRAKGLSIEPAGACLAALRPALRALRLRWSEGHRMAPMDFLARPASFDPELARERELLVAWRGRRPVGYVCLSPIYARRGALVQEWVQDVDAPNGTAELLLDAAFRRAAEHDLDYATLGLSPLAGRLPPWLAAARALGRPWFDFEGLCRFKAKFRPQRLEAVALAGTGLPIPALVVESLRAFAGGSFARFGAATLRRHLAVAWRS